MCKPHWRYTSKQGLEYRFYLNDDKTTYRTVITVLDNAPEIFETLTIHNQRYDDEGNLLNISKVEISEDVSRNKKFIIKNLITNWNIEDVSIYNLDQIDHVRSAAKKDSNCITTNLYLNAETYKEKGITENFPIKTITGKYNVFLNRIHSKYIEIPCEAIDVITLDCDDYNLLNCKGKITAKKIVAGQNSEIKAKNLIAEEINFKFCGDIDIAEDIRAKKITIDIPSMGKDVVSANDLTTDQLELTGYLTVNNNCKINGSFVKNKGEFDVQNLHINGDLIINELFLLNANHLSVQKNVDIKGELSGDVFNIAGNVVLHPMGHFDKFSKCNIDGTLKLNGYVTESTETEFLKTGSFKCKGDVFVTTHNLNTSGISSDKNIYISNCYTKSNAISHLKAKQLKLTAATVYNAGIETQEDIILEGSSQILQSFCGFTVGRDIIVDDSKFFSEGYYDKDKIAGKIKLSNGSIVKLPKNFKLDPTKVKNDGTSILMIGKKVEK